MVEAPFAPDLSPWDAWHPSEAARRLAKVDVPWCVAAGWALDLFRGRQTREHEDLEIAIPARCFDAVRDALEGLELYVIGAGLAHPFSAESLAAHHQTWGRDPASDRWRIDVMREPWDGGEWVFRRDPRVRLPAARAIGHTADGIPYAQPEIVLLFKAKAARPKDEQDFADVLPLLDRARRRWLASALELVHPGHRWLRAFADD
jgi:hypothetical protein